MTAARMDLYIGRVVLLAMIAALLGGGLLMYIFTMLDMLQGGAQSGLVEALSRTLRTMPRKIEELAPFAIFLGALIGLGNLSSNSELTILRGAGVSITRLFISVCIPSLLLILVTFLFIPMMFSADERDSVDRDRGFSNGWFSEGDTYSRIGWQANDGSLVDIQQFMVQDGEIVAVLTAGSATYEVEDGWTLNDVELTSYEADGVKVTQLPFKHWDTTRVPDSFNSLFTKSPRKMSLLELEQQIDDLKAARENPAEFQIVFWTKLLKPLSVFGLVLIALVFVVGSTRLVGMGTRLTFGVIVGFAFHYVQTLIAPVSIVFGISPLITIAVPIVLIWSAGLYLAHRVV